MQPRSPTVLLLDGDYPTSISIAAELSDDLDARILGAGTSRYSRLRRSKHCDVGLTVPATDDPMYAERVIDLLGAYRPDAVLPVGYRSARRLIDVQSRLPEGVSHCLPSRESFVTAEDKVTAMATAEQIGIDTPTDYSTTIDAIDESNRSVAALDPLSFPVFVKPRTETGGGHATTARVDRPADFWPTYERIEDRSADDDVLVQECITGSGSTYGCGLVFFDTDVHLLFAHEEVRSVPRHGGSGTHLRVFREPHLEAQSIRLLRELDWHGIALVEYKKRAEGGYVLMEINPKFWASYALASVYGYRFATTMVVSMLGLDVDLPIREPQAVGEMVFPLRELYHYARHPREESLLDSVATVLQPVPWNVDRRDASAWLTPPASVLGKVPGIEVGNSDGNRTSPRSAASDPSTVSTSSSSSTVSTSSSSSTVSTSSSSSSESQRPSRTNR